MSLLMESDGDALPSSTLFTCNTLSLFGYWERLHMILRKLGVGGPETLLVDMCQSLPYLVSPKLSFPHSAILSYTFSIIAIGETAFIFNPNSSGPSPRAMPVSCVT